MADFMKFANSTPYTVKLLSDAPETFEGKYGAQNNYSCEYNGKEVIVSQKIGSGLDLYLEGGRAGDVFVIEKRQDPQNPKNFPFHVEKGTPQVVEKAMQGAKVSNPASPDWDSINQVKDWNIQKAVAFKGACGLATELREVEENYHILFSMLRNDGLLIVDRINRCDSLVQLEALWKDEGALWVELVGLDKMGAIQKIKQKKADTFPQPKVEEPPPPPVEPEINYSDDNLPF